MNRLALLVFAALAMLAPNTPAPPDSTSDPGLEAFHSWLTVNRPGYGCDEGPAPFRNKTVQAAYPGQRFYYVLTDTRGIPPPFPNSVSLVAAIDGDGDVLPLRSLENFGRGLIPVKSARAARLAAAGVLIVTSCDPGERRWKYAPARFKAKRTSTGWKATYRYDNRYSSWVSFGKRGELLGTGGSAPPVP